MSMYYREHGKPEVRPKGKSMTKQAFADSTDINKILAKAQKTGTISHLAKHGAEYGDFSDFDFFEAHTRLARATEIFDELPAEMRKEFDHEPSKFFEFANDPQNVGKLEEILPKIAEPGRYFPQVLNTAHGPAAPATVDEEQKTIPEPKEPEKTADEAAKTE